MKLKKGFTLIELLVVVAIIGVLATVVMSSLNNVRSKTRDARRLSDMRQMQNALEMYYLDNGNYPPVNDWSYAAANPSNWNRFHSAIMDYIIAPITLSTMEAITTAITETLPQPMNVRDSSGRIMYMSLFSNGASKSQCRRINLQFL